MFYLFTGIPFVGLTLYKAYISNALFIHWHPYRRSYLVQNIPFAFPANAMTSLEARTAKSILFAGPTLDKASLSQYLLIQKHSFCQPCFIQSVLFACPSYSLPPPLPAMIIQKHFFCRASFIQSTQSHILYIYWDHFCGQCLFKSISFAGIALYKLSLSHALLI